MFDLDPLDRGIGDAKAVRSTSTGHVFDMDPVEGGKLINSTEFSAVDEWASLTYGSNLVNSIEFPAVDEWASLY